MPIKIISLSLPNGVSVIKVLPENPKKNQKPKYQPHSTSKPRDKDNEIKGKN